MINQDRDTFKSRLDLTDVQDVVGRIRQEIRKVIVGQQNMIDFLIAGTLADGHILLEGVPGIAKTLSAKLMAKTMSVGFSRIQFTPDLMPSDVLGTTVFNLKKSEFEFNRGPIFSNVILIDEINRAPAKTQSALFEVMEERQVTVDGVTYLMEKPFLVIATQNPIEQEGTYRLAEAQIDRFLFKVDINYPSPEEEAQILSEFHARRDHNNFQDVVPVISRAEILTFQNKIKSVHIDDPLIQYIAQIVHQTRNSASLYLGASPRASLAIMMGTKAFAAMNGRDFVTPEDVQHICYPALRHRLMLTPEKEMEGATPEDVVKEILGKIEVPR